MKPERGKQANHRARDDFRDYCEGVVLTDRRFSQSVYSSRHPARQSRLVVEGGFRLRLREYEPAVTGIDRNETEDGSEKSAVHAGVFNG